MVSKFMMVMICLSSNLFAASAGAGAGGAGAGAGSGLSVDCSEPVLIGGVLPIVLSDVEKALSTEIKGRFRRGNPRGYEALQVATTRQALPPRKLKLYLRPLLFCKTCGKNNTFCRCYKYEPLPKAEDQAVAPAGTVPPLVEIKKQVKSDFRTPLPLCPRRASQVASYTTYGK